MERHHGPAPSTPARLGPRGAGGLAGPGTPGPPLSPFTATPAADRLNAAELRFALKDAWRLIREKERDCALAAEIGSRLLEANEQLKSEYERVLVGYEEAVARQNNAAVLPTPSAPLPAPAAVAAPSGQGKRGHHHAGEDLTVNHVFELEQINQELQQKIDDLAVANADLERSAAYHDRRVEDLTAEHKRELAMALNAIRELENDKAQLVREKAEIAKHVKDGKKMSGAEEAYIARIDELENELAELTERARDAEEKLEPALREAEVWSTRCRDLEERCDGIEGLQDECAMLQCRVDELEGKLADERDLVGQLKAVINGEKSVASANLAAVDVYEDDENAHSLFSEVEDKRQALESRHNQLAAKHKGLMRVHYQNVHQQERMRNHISRLTQLTHSRTDEERLHRLEQALGEKDSENRALFARIVALERGGAVAGPVATATDDFEIAGGSTDVQTVETLRLRLSSLESECDYLRNELRTLKMLRVGEIEKLRKTERALGEKEEELERLRNEVAKWKWEAEEAKVMLEEKNVISATEELEVVSGTEPKKRRHIASQTEAEELGVSSSDAAVMTSPLSRDPVPAAREPADDQGDSPHEFTIRSIHHDLDSDTSSSASGSINMDNTFSNVTSASLKAGATQTRSSLLMAVTNSNMRREHDRTLPNIAGASAVEPTPARQAYNRDPLADIGSSVVNAAPATGPRRHRIPTDERKEAALDPASAAKSVESSSAAGSAKREPVAPVARAPKQVFVNKKGSAPSSADKNQEECKQQ